MVEHRQQEMQNELSHLNETHAPQVFLKTKESQICIYQFWSVSGLYMRPKDEVFPQVPRSFLVRLLFGILSAEGNWSIHLQIRKLHSSF